MAGPPKQPPPPRSPPPPPPPPRAPAPRGGGGGCLPPRPCTRGGPPPAGAAAPPAPTTNTGGGGRVGGGREGDLQGERGRGGHIDVGDDLRVLWRGDPDSLTHRDAADGRLAERESGERDGREFFHWNRDTECAGAQRWRARLPVEQQHEC